MRKHLIRIRDLICWSKTVSLFFLLCTLSCSEPQTGQETSVDGYNACFLVMDGTFNSELTAPYDIFHHTIFRDIEKPILPFTVSAGERSIQTFEGLTIDCDYVIGDAGIPPIDILVIPAAEHHLDSDLENHELIEFIESTSQNATYILSLCDGAFPLAETGLLDGRHCTTFPGDIEEFKTKYPETIVHEDVLWVQDGMFITSAGGAKSFEPALYLVELLFGEIVARDNAIGMVMDWDKSKLEYFVNTE